MAEQLQLRRGTTTEHAVFTGAVAEITVDTDKDVVVVHDGVFAGGYPLAKQSDVDLKAPSISPSFTTPSLGVATAASINKVTITAPSTSATLTIANGKTLTVNNSIAIAGADSTVITLPAVTGAVPLNNQTMYIGTTAATINRASANLALTGITSIAMPGSTSGTAILSPAAAAGTPTITLPTATGTLATLAGTETLSNKTFIAPNIGAATGTSFNSITALSSTTPIMDGVATIGTGATVARADHIHPSDTSRAPLDSPSLTGTPTAPIVPAGTNTTQIATTGFVVGEKGGRRNYLINGNFDKWDYATSQTTNGYGSDNRWKNANSGSTKTHSQVACGDTERALFNAMYFSRTVVTSVAGAGNYVNKFQRIENVNLLAGKTVTVSFWAKADANKNIAIEFGQNFGTGGSPSVDTYGISSQLVALTTTWQKKTVTVTIPSIVGKTLGTDGAQTTSTYITVWLDAGSNFTQTAGLGQQSGTFDIAQVKIEDGSVATNGWHPYDGEFGGETAACARYYEVQDMKIWTDTINGSLYGYRTMFVVKKRIIPTITQLAFTGSNFSSISIENPSLISVGTYSQATSTANSQSWVYTFSASAEL